MLPRSPRSAFLLATALSLTVASLVPVRSASAQESGTNLVSIEKQIQALQAELKHMKQQAAERDRQLHEARQAQTYTPPATQPLSVMPQIPAGYALVPAAPGSTSGSVVLSRVETPPKLPQGTFQVGALTVQLGGYFDASTIFRSRNEVTDLSSNFNSAIPFRSSPLYHENEFRETARGTRISGTVTANPDEDTRIRGFVAIDFQGGSPTSNSAQTNGFEPRIREGWMSYDRKDLGFQFVAGQAFSLLTQNKVGVDPSQMNLPLTIDQNYVPGFTYTRQSQVRLAKSFAQNQYWLAISFENPQGVYADATIPTSLGTLNVTNPGVGSLGTGSNTTVSACTAVATTIVAGKATSVCTTSAATATGNFSDDIAPDVVAKATADYNIAHLEAYGIGRVFHDRISHLGTGDSNTTFGGGGGASALVHIIPNLLDVTANGIVGTGLGRYGPAQLPDATIGSDGKPATLPEYQALIGLIGHPDPKIDVYGYLGTEQIARRYFNAENKGELTAYGYGNPSYSNAGCEVELSEPCTANTSGIVQGTVGAYYKFLKSQYGTFQFGGQYSYTHRSVFQGVGRTPETDENIVLLSFRYYPFQ